MADDFLSGVPGAGVPFNPMPTMPQGADPLAWGLFGPYGMNDPPAPVPLPQPDPRTFLEKSQHVLDALSELYGPPPTIPEIAPRDNPIFDEVFKLLDGWDAQDKWFESLPDRKAIEDIQKDYAKRTEGEAALALREQMLGRSPIDPDKLVDPEIFHPSPDTYLFSPPEGLPYPEPKEAPPAAFDDI